MHDCQGTYVPICPYCGTAQDDSEMKDANTYECDSCAKLFFCEPEYSITYTTTCHVGEHDWDEWSEVDSHTGWQARRCKRCDQGEVRETATR